MPERITSYLVTLRARLRQDGLLAASGVAAVAAICWVGGWHTLHDVGTDLIWAGTVIIVLGAFGVSANRDVVGDPTYLLLRSLEPRRGRYDPLQADRHYADTLVHCVRAVRRGRRRSDRARRTHQAPVALKSRGAWRLTASSMMKRAVVPTFYRC